MYKYCRVGKLLNNAYLLATIGFDTAENEHAKILQNLQKFVADFANFAKSEANNQP